MDINRSLLPIYGCLDMIYGYAYRCVCFSACHSAMRPGMSTYLSPTGIEPVSSTWGDDVLTTRRKGPRTHPFYLLDLLFRSEWVFYLRHRHVLSLSLFVYNGWDWGKKRGYRRGVAAGHELYMSLRFLIYVITLSYRRTYIGHEWDMSLCLSR
jgi:hypothetical protein